MTDRPILFQAPMVRAILDGRKTQLRPVLKPLPRVTTADLTWTDCPGLPGWRAGHIPPDLLMVPYAVGDRLWVRETWQTHCDMDQIAPRNLPHDAAIQYPATYDGWVSRRRPGIHMPRWASRLTLVVTEVRVQRLQDISEADAIAEGVEQEEGYWRDYLMPATQICTTARDSFRTLWTSIRGPTAWTDNPWVTPVTFRPHACNIDAMPADDPKSVTDVANGLGSAPGVSDRLRDPADA